MNAPAPPARDWARAAALMAALALAMQGYAVLLGRIPWFMDTLAEFYPMRHHGFGLLRAGEWPWWNRCMLAGVPLLANPQPGLLYPGHWPMLLLHGPRGFSLINLLHLFWLGLGMFAWLRALAGGGLRGPAAAGLLAMAGGWTWAHLAFVSYLQAASWLPWWLWALERFLRVDEASLFNARLGPRRGPAAALVGGAAAGMPLLAGAPQLALYIWAGVWLFALLRAALAPERGALKRALAFLLGSCFFGIAWSAPQWMPSQAFLAECERHGGLALDEVRAGTLDAAGLARAWFGGTGRPEDAESIVYPGLLATLLALAGLAAGLRAGARRRAAAAGLLALVLAGLLLAWRLPAPLFHRYLPFYDQFHDPRRLLVLAYIGCAALAGLGLGQLARRLPAWALWALLALAVAEPFAFSQWRIDVKTIDARPLHARRPDAAWGIAPGERFFALDHGIQYSYNYTRQHMADSLLPLMGMLYGLEDIQAYDPFLPWRSAAFLRLANRAPRPAVALYPRHFALVRNPDSPWLARFGPLKARGPLGHRWPFLVPRWIAPAQAADFPFREGAVDAPRGLLLLAAAGDPQGHPATPATIPVEPLDSQGRPLASLEMKSRDGYPPGRVEPEVLPQPGISALAAWQTDWIGPQIAGLRVRNPDPAQGLLVYSIGIETDPAPWQPLDTPGSWRRDAATGFGERLLVVAPPDTAPPREREQAIARLMRPELSVLELPPDSPWSGHPARVVEPAESYSSANHRFQVTLPQGHAGGWLLVSEPWARGWRCRVEGEQRPIYPVDLMFRAVPVEPGERWAEFDYSPPGLREGLVFCVTALVLAAGLLWASGGQGRSRRQNLRG